MFRSLDHIAKFLDEIYSAQEVDFQDFLINAEVGVERLLALRDAGVQHKEVDAHTKLHHVIVEFIYGTVVIESGLRGPGLNAQGLTFAFHLVQVVNAQSSEDQVAAFLCQMDGDGAANARSTSGYNGMFAF